MDLGREIKSNSGFPEDGTYDTFSLPSGHSSPLISMTSDVFTAGFYLDSKYPALGSFTSHEIKMEEKINGKDKGPSFQGVLF